MEVIEQPSALALSRRQAIMSLQASIATSGLDTSTECCPVRHFWAPGQYAREMFLPADKTVIGKIHKHAHINVVSQGRALVFTEQYGTQEVVAPATFVSPAGTKRVVVTLEDTVWTTVHVTDKLTVAECEADLVRESYGDAP